MVVDRLLSLLSFPVCWTCCEEGNKDGNFPDSSEVMYREGGFPKTDCVHIKRVQA